MVWLGYSRAWGGTSRYHLFLFFSQWGLGAAQRDEGNYWVRKWGEKGGLENMVLVAEGPLSSEMLLSASRSSFLAVAWFQEWGGLASAR